MSDIYNTLASLKIILPNKINNNYKKIINKNQEIKDLIINHTKFISGDFDSTLRERIYCIQKYITSVPICKHCKINQTKFHGYTYGYLDHCSAKCAQKNEKTRITHINTMKTKYGVEFAGQTEEQKEKRKNTCLKRYGTTHHWKNKDIQAKKTKTFIEKYGTSNPRQKHIEEKSLILLNDKEFLKKEHLLKEKNLQEIGELLNVHYSTVGNYLKKYNIRIRRLSTSKQEKEIIEFLEQYNINIEKRFSISRKEIDIFLPDYNIGIEFNGIFWHSELVGKDKKYHLNKLNLMEENNILLIQIWENEWLYKKEIVESRILSKLNLNKKIYGRKTKIVSLNKKDSKKFIEENHIQGFCNSSIQYGLIYENELVALMTFGNPRFNKNYEWEMLRYCCKKYTNVIGGASKLLKHFINYHNPKNIISYSDNRWGNGNLYFNLNFEFNNITSPNYYYFHQKTPTTLYPRIKFQKHKLEKILPIYDPTLTEWENMKNNKYNRIWDCGNKVFIYKNIAQSK